MRELFAQNESQIVQKSYGPKTDRPDLNNTARLAPNMVDSPRGIIDTSLMEQNAQVSILTTQRERKDKGKITIRGDGSFETSVGGAVVDSEGSVL